jgi:hypothetical protein
LTPAQFSRIPRKSFQKNAFRRGSIHMKKAMACSSTGILGRTLLVRVCSVLAVSAVAFALACGNAAGQGIMKTAPAPNPNITLAGPQAHHPSPGRALPGTVEGFVYWDTRAITHNPAGACNGFSVSVIAGGHVLQAVGGQFGAKPIAQVKSFLANGTIEVYDVCTYAYDNLPENTPLHVELSITQPTAFSTAVAPASPITGPLTIISPRCNMLPDIVTATLADLTAHWGSCQDMAFDVNFQLVAASGAARAAMLSPRSRTLLQTTPTAPGGAKGSSSGGPLMTPSAQTTLLGDGSVRPAPGSTAGPTQPMGATGKNTSLSAITPAGNSNTSAGGKSLTSFQPLVPRGGTNSGSAAGKAPLVPASKLLKAKLGPAKKGPTIVNQAAASRVAAITAMLRSQRESANTEAAQMMKLGIHPAGPNTSLGPSQTMSASVGGTPTQQNNRTAANAQMSTATGTTGSSNSQRILTNAGARLGISESLPLICAHDPTMRIVSVSGNEGPITFTTDPSGNFYTITGCSFANPGPNATVYIYYQNSFHQEFQIQQWNDNYIKCNLDPSLTNVGDLDNLTLVVQRSDGQQAAKTGFKFYAMRETRRLAVFPKQYFSLDKFNLQDLSDLTGGVYSPVDPTGYFPNSTAEATWFDPDLAAIKDKKFVTPQSTPPTGTDIYDFSHLAPGFDVTSAQISWPDPSAYCSGMGDSLVASSGTFGGQWNGSQLWVTWQGWNCNWNQQNCNFWGCTDVFEVPITDYAVDVIVEGPRGLDPWSGQPIGH